MDRSASLIAKLENITEVAWLLADHLGTIRDVAEYDLGTDTTTVVNHLRYGAFGAIVSQSSSSFEPRYTFTGREWDADAQLFYYRARWYDADAGRFVSEDPIGFAAGDTNVQRYVGNGVSNRSDATGLDWLDDYTDWFLHTSVGGTIYTGNSAPTEEMIAVAGVAAGDNYLDNARLAHEAFERTGPIGMGVSGTLELIEGDLLHQHVMTHVPPGHIQIGPGPILIPPPFQFMPWNQALMLGIRDYFAWFAAAGQFGQYMHQNFGPAFADAYDVPVEQIIDNTGPGVNGPDLQLPPDVADDLGLNPNIELKPFTASGIDRLQDQMDRWDVPVSQFLYDYDGHVWHDPTLFQ